jgi:hypothetical protein
VGQLTDPEDDELRRVHPGDVEERDQAPLVDERHPEGVQGLPGYVWLDMPGKVRSVGEHELEFTEEAPPIGDLI